jgi:uncharacterized protein
VLWDGHAMAKDGQAYDNRYCWVMRIEEGKVKDAVAFFDSSVLTDLFERVDGERGGSMSNRGDPMTAPK